MILSLEERSTMQIGDVIDGKYELVKLLGKGGMGSVWEARHVVIGRRVALKCLHQSLTSDADVLARFQREAQAAAAIGSEHIVDVQDVGTLPGGAPYLVMEHLEGKDLSSLLNQSGPMDPSVVRSAAIQACRALSAAHARGIIHRDLKPENLFLTIREDNTPWIKLIDFGIAKLKASVSGEESAQLTATGTSLGSPYYMSPEQVRASKDLDHRTDIYSMGVVLYELLTGERPFQGGSVNDIIIAIATETPVPPRELRPDLDEAFERLILKAMAREPEDRHQTTTELAGDLAALEREPTTPIAPSLKGSLDDEVPQDERTRTASGTGLAWQSAYLDAEARQRRRPTALVVAVALIAVLAVGVSLYIAFDGGSEPGLPTSSSGDSAALETSLTAAPVDDEQPREDEVTTTPEPEARQVRLEIRARPSSARVLLDGEELGGVPYEGVIEQDDAEHRLEVVADGHEPESRVIRLDGHLAIEVILRPTQRPRPSAPTKVRAHDQRARQEPERRRPAKLELDNDNPYGGGG